MAARRATSSVNWAALGARMTGPGQKAVFTVSKIYHVSRNLYLPTNEWQPEKSCLINELGSHDDFVNKPRRAIRCVSQAEIIVFGGSA